MYGGLIQPIGQNRKKLEVSFCHYLDQLAVATSLKSVQLKCAENEGNGCIRSRNNYYIIITLYVIIINIFLFVRFISSRSANIRKILKFTDIS